MTPVNRKAGTGERTRELPWETCPGSYSPVGFRHHWFERQISWCLSGGGAYGKTTAMRPFLTSRDRSGFLELYTHAPTARSNERQERSDWVSEEAEKDEHPLHWALTLWGPLWRNKQKTALNMAKFIQNQSRSCWRSLTSLIPDAEADLWEKLHDDARHLFPYTVRRDWMKLQDGNWWARVSISEAVGLRHLLRLVALLLFTRWLTVVS